MTNTYQASVDGFVKYLNVSEEESYNLIKKAVDYTRIARKRFYKEYPQLSTFTDFFAQSHVDYKQNNNF